MALHQKYSRLCLKNNISDCYHCFVPLELCHTMCIILFVQPEKLPMFFYFLDKDGYIFDESPYFSGEVYFKFYGLTELIEDVPSGFYFLKQNFQKLTLLKETFENMGLKPVALYLLDNGDVKIFLSTENSLFTGPEIIFKIDSDFKKIAENLEVALTTEPLQTDFKNK